MRQSVAEHRQSKFDWGWKYRHNSQGHMTIKEVLAKAKIIIVIKKQGA